LQNQLHFRKLNFTILIEKIKGMDKMIGTPELVLVYTAFGQDNRLLHISTGNLAHSPAGVPSTNSCFQISP
jgi:hypothetical protein